VLYNRRDGVEKKGRKGGGRREVFTPRPLRKGETASNQQKRSRPGFTEEDDLAAPGETSTRFQGGGLHFITGKSSWRQGKGQHLWGQEGRST